jgi:hypothetical protein
LGEFGEIHSAVITEASFSETEQTEEGSRGIGRAGSEQQLTNTMKRALEIGEGIGTGSDAHILHRGEQIREGVENAGVEPFITIIRTVRGVKALDEDLDVQLGYHILIMPNAAG